MFMPSGGVVIALRAMLKSPYRARKGVLAAA
jgi:hypothetical protein